MNYRTVVRSMAFAFGCFFIAAIMTLLLFEVIYRYQLIDTYLSELHAYNPDSVLQSNGEEGTILVMGDSFTAGEYSYPRFLREMLPDYRIINAGISGTGVIQASLVASRRFTTYTPSVLVYQIYVGNDLINIRYPVNWRTVGPLRNLYGMVVDHLRSVSFLNYRLAQLRYELNPQPVAKGSVPAVFNSPFSPETYSPTQKNYIRADASILEDQILVSGDRQRDFEVLLQHLKGLTSYCGSSSCDAYIMVVPHACQVHPRYLDHMRALGAQFRHPDRLSVERYPFVDKLQHAFADAPGIHILNLLPLLQRHEQDGHVLFFNNDGHLNPEGQKIVASFLKEQLIEPQSRPFSSANSNRLENRQ